MTIDKEKWEEISKFREYISSKEWKELKEERLKKDNYKCVLCKSQERLTCHHLTYKRIFKEEINDLISLCKKCHSRIHSICPPRDTPHFVKRLAWDNLFELSEEEREEMLKGMVKLMGWE